MQNKPLEAAPAVGSTELALLGQLRKRATRLPSVGVRLGIGDDCALLRLRKGEEMAITTDFSIAGRHFRFDWHPPESVGHRTLARGLSDLASMGARPVAAFLSLGLPRELTLARGPQRSWMDRFFDGLFALAKAYDVSLAGGDLAESPMAVADIILAGAVPRGRALLRSRAQAGQILYVTGALGGSAAALDRLGRLSRSGKSQVVSGAAVEKEKNLLAPQLFPQPRVAQGLWLQRRKLATAAIDLSDGLSTDLFHLCEESHVAAEIDATGIPVHPGATLAQALNGGEDYELLFTAPASARVPRAIAGVPITPIGRIVRRSGRPTVTLLTSQGRQPLEAKGWQYFS